MESSDRELVDRLLSGTPEAASEVEGWIRRAASPFRARLGADWEDSVQDALVELVSALRRGSFRGEGALRGYVWRLSARNCLDRLRRRRRWVEVEVDESLLPSEAATALTELLRAEDRRRLRDLVAGLPAHCRELWAEILAGHGYREMSQRLGASEGALRVRVLRCRRRALEMAGGRGARNAAGLGAPST